MLFQHPSHYKIDSIYSGHIDSLDISTLFHDPNSIIILSLLYIQYELAYLVVAESCSVPRLVLSGWEL